MYTNTLKGSGGSNAELTIGSIVPYLQFGVQITAVITTTQTSTSPPTPQCCWQHQLHGPLCQSPAFLWACCQKMASVSLSSSCTSECNLHPKLYPWVHGEDVLARRGIEQRWENTIFLHKAQFLPLICSSCIFQVFL